MLITTANDLPGYEITEKLGEVFGLTVRSRNVGEICAHGTAAPALATAPAGCGNTSTPTRSFSRARS